MKVKEIIFEDFVNYKRPCMFIGTCRCDWKCCIENANCKCQNAGISRYPDIIVEDERIIKLYLDNPITHAVVFGGLEPLLQFEEVIEFIRKFRKCSNDDVVIYTGYFPEEIEKEVNLLKIFPNIVMKFGRFRPDESPHFDEVLGVDLPNREQFGMKIS